jgi:hypothetical protein
VAQFVYVDETGSVGTGAAAQPYLTIAAVLVPEEKVRPLAKALEDVAWKHLGWLPSGFEFHGHEIWGGTRWWDGKTPSELLAVYEDAISVLDTLDLAISHASIDKAKLHAKYSGEADANAYRLALQFLLEKVDRYGGSNKIVVADETKEQQLPAIKMVADMQQWGGGEVPGRTLRTIIDTLHFVPSNMSPGVQMADLVVYVLQRSRRGKEGHPDALAALRRLRAMVDRATPTWREPWP